MADDTTRREPPIQFRPSAFLRAQLAARVTEAAEATSTNAVAARDLIRYYEVLRRAVPQFAPAEARLLVAAFATHVAEGRNASLLWAVVADAIRYERLDGAYGVDGEALVQRLRDELTPFALLAIADAVERLAGSPDLTDADLRAVGLVR